MPAQCMGLEGDVVYLAKTLQQLLLTGLLQSWSRWALQSHRCVGTSVVAAGSGRFKSQH